jgi:radical SAM superfamily enzyme YgiQ (UPF0313 family)
MKALLISANTSTEPYVVYPLGTSIVAGALHAAGHDVRQLDAMVHPDFKGVLTQAVGDFRPDLVGVGIRNLDSANSMDGGGSLVDNAVDIIRHLRTLTRSPIVVGGSGFSLAPAPIMALTGADYGIVGEGEDALVELAARIEAGAPSNDVMMVGRTTVMRGAFHQPDLVTSYRTAVNMMPIQTKRGCSFRCAYCSYPVLEGNDVRMRDPEQVVEEMIHLHEQMSVSMVFFVDSVFNDARGRYLELLELLLKRGISIPWSAFLTPFGLGREEMDLMVRTGLVWAEVGADGASDATLRGLHKPFRFKDVARVCTELQKRRVSVVNNVMFGCPGETEETVKEGVANLLALEQVFSIVFCGIRLILGTEMETLARSEGVIGPEWTGLEAVYYYAPGISRSWLERTLTEAFSGSPMCVFPPQEKNDTLRMIHRIGFTNVRNLSL